MNLRPYQVDAVENIRRAFAAGYKSVLFVLPTGGGKTVIFNHVAKSASAKQKRVSVLVHRIELIRQTYSKLQADYVRTGVIHPMFTPDPGAPVQVASVQTLVRRLKKIALNYDLIIIDEAHHATAGTWEKIIAAVHEVNPNCRILGVTATPIRTDGRGLGKHVGGVFDILVQGPQITDLINEGFLVRPVVLGSKTKIDLTRVKITAGDYNQSDLSEAVDKPQITGDAVEHYARVCPNVPAVAFCVTVAHAKHVADQFRAAGFRSEAVDGTMSDDERSRILGGLADGTMDVVTSCELISEGTDIPAIGAAILLRPTKSTGLYLQQVGRSLRPVPGKQCAYILDHVDNWVLHGLPDDERTWSLDGDSKKKRKGNSEKTIPTEMCEKCYAVYKPAPACPICGHEKPIDTAAPKQVEGELIEITPEVLAEIRRKKQMEVGRAQTYEELLQIARQRGYKPGWAKKMFEIRQSKKMGADVAFR